MINVYVTNWLPSYLYVMTSNIVRLTHDACLQQRTGILNDLMSRTWLVSLTGTRPLSIISSLVVNFSAYLSFRDTQVNFTFLECHFDDSFVSFARQWRATQRSSGYWHHPSTTKCKFTNDKFSAIRRWPCEMHKLPAAQMQMVAVKCICHYVTRLETRWKTNQPKWSR